MARISREPSNGEKDIINDEPVKVDEWTYQTREGRTMTVTMSASSNLAERGFLKLQEGTNGGYKNGNSTKPSNQLLTYDPLFEPTVGLFNVEASNALLIVNDAFQLVDLATSMTGVFGLGKELIEYGLKTALKKGIGTYSELKKVLTTSQRKVKGLQKQIDEHTKKLEDFIKDPDKFDNKGFLKDASPELREKIIETRINNLKKQINNFKNLQEKAQSEAKEKLFEVIKDNQ